MTPARCNEMPVRKLDNGELVQIVLSHDEAGVIYATVYGIGFKIQKNSKEYNEAYELAQMIADKVEIITDE